MPDPSAVVAQQVEMYGEPLGVRFGRLLEIYSISQARLAAVIGLSPPMLSQLMSGQRAKISNPAVLGRVARLEELADTVGGPARDVAAVAAVLSEVTASRPALGTRRIDQNPGDAERRAMADAVEALARVADPQALARAAGQVDDPRLRHILGLAAGR